MNLMSPHLAQQQVPARHDIDPGSALGLLITFAVEHLITQDWCCPACCPACAALAYYEEELPEVAGMAVAKALPGLRRDWQMEADAINWPYLKQFWAPPADHTCS